ncbi:DUF1902 domain-containing protein [Acidisoma silvae]|uniref:DUF1902 domain-containing protein n=1 Tax=Acidisoma silvae TaxID=2802396 RepID=A0A964DZL6_9PROT|nr:DUF1902 domain-containing protein [Acidisoma silvae]
MGLTKAAGKVFDVMAHWDAEASVWWAESNDLRGLVAESDTIEGLIADVREIVPELLRLNGDGHGSSVILRFAADRSEEITFA